MAAGTPTTYRGSDAKIYVSGTKVQDFGGGSPGIAMSTFGFGDYSMTLARGTVEQPLVGEIGNFKAAGTLTCEGSFTVSKLDSNAAVFFLASMITGGRMMISGNAGANSVSWYYASCMLSGFDIKLGDANTITTATVGYKVMDPQCVVIKDTGMGATGVGVLITDAA